MTSNISPNIGRSISTKSYTQLIFTTKFSNLGFILAMNESLEKLVPIHLLLNHCRAI
ncbi:hypothetical protein DPMN_084908 [Dreissena polymorpha]|uniref:Uncharacterized protein n=1 Tax=Dreissena polymorpha TaxID=45954 RepID=A0A9D3YCM7_DREPO|nr:hypothetical protein DPMN_084908 [Dreissena polymorpha]